MLTGTFLIILLGIAAVIPPLRYNKFYILNAASITCSAYFFEKKIYAIQNIFTYKTILLFIIFHLISINLITFIAYGIDKKAAITKTWRIPEKDLHTLEFLGGWIGAFVGQKFFRHKTVKKSYQITYKIMIILEFALIIGLLKYFKFI